MECPRCNVALNLREHRGVRVNECERCGGMFLHRGELNKVAEPTQGDLEFSTLHGESFRHDDSFGPILCPDCGAGPMDKVEFNIHTDIVLDHCAACGGFWLDGREYDRINEEVRDLAADAGPGPDSKMIWFARFIWSLPR